MGMAWTFVSIIPVDVMGRRDSGLNRLFCKSHGENIRTCQVDLAVGGGWCYGLSPGLCACDTGGFADRRSHSRDVPKQGF